LTGAAAVVAAASLPLPLPEAKGVDLGLGEFGPQKYFVTWWDKVELDSFCRVFEGLKDGRFDAVVEH
jgi:hypothetical protein